MTWFSSLRYSVFALVALIIAGLAYVTLAQPIKPNPLEFGGSFELQASSGRTITRASLTGKPYALFFGFTNCPDVCPSTMMDLARLMEAVGDKAKDFHPYFISVDPSRDTPELLKTYLTAFDPRIIGLTGSEADINAVVKSFKIYRKKNGTGEHYSYDHTSSVLLFAANGELAGTISVTEPFEDQRKKLERLLKG